MTVPKMENEKLKPCPFCGGRAKFMETRVFGRGKTRASCATCSTSTTWLSGEDEAAKVWNRRTEPAAESPALIAVDDSPSDLIRRMWATACRQVRDARGALCLLAIAHSDGDVTIGLYPYDGDSEEADDM